MVVSVLARPASGTSSGKRTPPEGTDPVSGSFAAGEAPKTPKNQKTHLISSPGRVADADPLEMLALPERKPSGPAGSLPISGAGEPRAPSRITKSERFVSGDAEVMVLSDDPPRGESEPGSTPIGEQLRHLIREHYRAGMTCGVRAGDRCCCEVGTEAMLVQGAFQGHLVSPGLFCPRHAWMMHVLQSRGELGGVPLLDNEASQLALRVGAVCETEAAATEADWKNKLDVQALFDFARALYVQLGAEREHASRLQLEHA